MFNIQKDHCFRFITSLFLVVFVFLKVTQYYNPVPIIARRDDHNQRSSEKLNLHLQKLSFSRLMDKCVIELKDESFVPKIKFSGTILYLFYSALLFPLLRYPKKEFKEMHCPPKDRLCSTLCVFRLWFPAIGVKSSFFFAIFLLNHPPKDRSNLGLMAH